MLAATRSSCCCFPPNPLSASCPTMRTASLEQPLHLCTLSLLLLVTTQTNREPLYFSRICIVDPNHVRVVDLVTDTSNTICLGMSSGASSSSGTAKPSNLGQPKWFVNLPDPVKQKIISSIPADEVTDNASAVGAFHIDLDCDNKHVACLQDHLNNARDIPKEMHSTLDAILNTIRNMEEEARLKEFEFAKAITRNEIRSCAALDAAAQTATDVAELRAGLADASRQYSKRCLTFSGKHLPDRCDAGASDGTTFLVEKVIKSKLNITLSDSEKAEIGVSHYRWPTGTDLVAKFNRHDADSVFDRLLKASRQLSKKDPTTGKSTRDVEIWVRIAENKRDASSMFLLRQMSKSGQAVAVDVARSGKPTALVCYGTSTELRRLHFDSVDDVRAVMNQKSQDLEAKADYKNMARRAEMEWNNIQSTSAYKAAFYDNAGAKNASRLRDFASTGEPKQLSEASRIDLAFDHRERLKTVMWRNAPNTSFGIVDTAREDKDKRNKKRTRDNGNGNMQNLGAPPEKSTRPSGSPTAAERLKSLASGRG
jgi:hypothetical protein